MSDCHPKTSEHIALCESDARFVRSLVRSEPGAWNAFHERYGRLLFAAIQRVRARFPRLVSGDDVQEIYSSLSEQLLANDKRRLRSYDPERGTRLSSWLNLLATHCAYDFLRARRRQPLGRSVHEDGSALERLCCNAPDPLRICVAREDAAHVAELVASLSERDQLFVALYYGEGLSPEKTAQRLGVRVSTVYSKKHKIRARMEQLLESRQAA